VRAEREQEKELPTKTAQPYFGGESNNWEHSMLEMDFS